MKYKALVAVAFAATLVPAVANAQRDYEVPSQPVAQRDQGLANRVTTFLTDVIIPHDSGQPSVAYADNPDLIGSRRGSTDMAWRR